MEFLQKPIYLSTLVVLSQQGLEQGFDATLDNVTELEAKHHAENVTRLETCKTGLAAAVRRAVAGEWLQLPCSSCKHVLKNVNAVLTAAHLVAGHMP